MKIKCKPLEKTLLRCPHCNEISYIFIKAKPKNPWYSTKHTNLAIGVKDGLYHKGSHIESCQRCDVLVLKKKDWIKEVVPASFADLYYMSEEIMTYLKSAETLSRQFEALRRYKDWMRFTDEEFSLFGQHFAQVFNKIQDFRLRLGEQLFGDKIKL